MTAATPIHRAPLNGAPLSAALLLTAALSTLSTATAQDATDTIVRSDGSSVRGVTVTRFALDTVKFQRGKEPDEVELAAHLVADVHWGGTPDNFVSAMAALDRGEYETARQLFGEVANGDAREVLKAEARFLQGKAAVGAGAGDQAAAANAAGALRAWISEFPDNFRLPEAMYLLGRALRLGGVAADGEATMKELDDRAVRDGWGAIWSARAKYELALCQLDQGKTLDARSSFQSAGGAASTALAATGGKDQELAAIVINSRVGEGETLIHEKDYQRAADFFRNLAQNPDPALAASGKAGQGEALFLDAAAKSDAGALRRAQVALAEACVLDTGTGDTSAKANYYLGRVLRTLGEDAGQDAKARATAYFEIVTRSYPKSRWAAAAKAELTK